MINCRMCKRDRDTWDPDDNICKECWNLEKMRTTIQSASKTTKRHKVFLPDERVETPSKQSETLLSYAKWAQEQIVLAKTLGLKESLHLIGRTCQVCGGRVPKQSHLELCKEHREQYLRWVNMMYQRKHRAKKVSGL